MLKFYDDVRTRLDELASENLMKGEPVLLSPQGAQIMVGGERQINLCANNYLGLANHPDIVAASIAATQKWGAGSASVRFICGTSGLHKELEAKTAAYLGYEDCITFAAAFDANGGVFEALFGPEDAIISDALNHASIIDGIRLCKAQRYRYANNDMADLEAQLVTARAAGARHVVIVCDGVFSMDGYVADLAAISKLAKQYDALVLVDDCHSTGVLGAQGQGTASHCGVDGCVDILTGTYGKALGGAMGGFICASRDVVTLLRERARPYLFSNALAPAVCGAAIAALDIASGSQGDALRHQIRNNAAQFRAGLTAAGFDLLNGDHPIIPVMLGDAGVASQLASALMTHGIYVRAFAFPVVPRGKARIRTQMSAALDSVQIDHALAIIIKAGKSAGAIA